MLFTNEGWTANFDPTQVCENGSQVKERLRDCDRWFFFGAGRWNLRCADLSACPPPVKLLDCQPGHSPGSPETFRTAERLNRAIRDFFWVAQLSAAARQPSWRWISSRLRDSHCVTTNRLRQI